MLLHSVLCSLARPRARFDCARARGPASFRSTSGLAACMPSARQLSGVLLLVSVLGCHSTPAVDEPGSTGMRGGATNSDAGASAGDGSIGSAGKPATNPTRPGSPDGGGAMGSSTTGGMNGAGPGDVGGQVGGDAPMTADASGCVASPFELRDISLESSDFTANRDRTLEYLRAVNADTLLATFRSTFGLPAVKAPAPGGWDAPDSQLRGHTTGHVLKALAQAYAGTGDVQYKTKADYMVSELKKCQDAAVAKGFGEGFLSAYSPDQFSQLEKLTAYPTIWAPYYTLHKILAGLLASYQLTQNDSALDVAKKVGVWVHDRLSKVDRAQLQKMWNLYIAGEVGGMNEVLAELYKITGDKLFLDTAVLFDKDLVLDSCAAHQDKLGGLHANQHIPTITGYLRVFDGTGTDKYRSAAQNFWSMVTTNHTYIIGGTGEAEMFRPAGEIASAITVKTCETCATYNMLKLTRQLFCHDPDAKYMDYYERGLYNHILGSQDPTSTAGGPVTYFVPLNPGGQRTYDAGYTCCHGTGMENHTKYQEQIYSHSSDNSQLYVNLYIASTLNWKARGFTIAQSTMYPYEPTTKLTVTGSGPLKVALRVPAWATDGFVVMVNGVDQKVAAKPASYVTVDRTWASGDVLTVSMPFTFRVETTPDDKKLGGILYGPEVLVVKSDKTSTIPLTLDMANPAASFTPNGTEPLSFTSNGLKFSQFSKATNAPYHTYFKF